MINIGPLAQRIMTIAAEHPLQPGQPLPAAVFDLFLEESPERIGEALDELYLASLLEEVPHDVDLLSTEGVEYCQALV